MSTQQIVSSYVIVGACIGYTGGLGSHAVAQIGSAIGLIESDPQFDLATK